MKPKTLIPFVIILVVLGGLVVFRQSQEQPMTMTEQAELREVATAELSPETVQRIELNAGALPDEKVVLQREGEGWVVASHFNAPVDPEVIDTYLKKMAAVKGESRAVAADDEALAPYSLKDDEAFHVRAYTGGDEPALHLLYGKAPDFRSVFFRKAGDMEVLTEGIDLRTEAGSSAQDLAAAPTPDKWLDKDILKLERDKVTQLAIKTPDKEYTLARREVPKPETPEAAEAEGEAPAPETAEPEYNWVMATGGMGEEIKAGGVDKIFQRLQNFAGSDVVDPALKADYGLDAPAFRLAITRDGEPEIVLLGAHKDTAGPGYVIVEGAAKEVVYEVSKFNFESMFPRGGDFYDLPKVALDSAQVNRVEINGPAGKLVLAKDGENWTMQEPQLALELDQAKVETLVNSASKLQTLDFADAADISMNYTVTLTQGDVTRTIQGGDASPSFEGTYVKLDGDDKVYAVAATDAKNIFLSPTDLTSLEAFPGLDVSAISGITLSHEGKTVQVAKQGEAWEVTVDAEAPFPGDPTRVGGLTDQLATLVFSGFATDRTADWTPLMNIAFTTADGAAHALNIGPAEGDTHPVQRDAGANVFQLSLDDLNKFKYHFNGVQTKVDPATAQEAPAPAPAEEAAVEMPAEVNPISFPIELPTE